MLMLNKCWIMFKVILVKACRCVCVCVSGKLKTYSCYGQRHWLNARNWWKSWNVISQCRPMRESFWWKFLVAISWVIVLCMFRTFSLCLLLFSFFIFLYFFTQLFLQIRFQIGRSWHFSSFFQGTLLNLMPALYH